MEPITIMVLAALITKVVTTHREDMEYARHGQDSPRYKMRLAKLAAAQKAGRTGGRPPVRPGASGYMQELWRDAWEDLTEHRRRQRETRNAGKRQQHEESLRDWSKRSLNTRPDGRPVDDMVDVAGVRPGTPEKGGSIPKPPAPQHTPEHPTHGAQDADATPRNNNAWGWSCRRQGCAGKGFDYDSEAEARAGAAKHQCADTGTPPSEGVQILGGGPNPRQDRPTADHDPAKCNRCPYGRITGTRPWPGSDGSSPDADQLCDRCGWLSSHMSGKTWDQWAAELNKPSAEPTPTAPSPWPPPQPDPKPADPIDVDTPDNVIPLFPNAKETVMTVNAEATGLPTAIAYADAAAQAHDAFATAGSEGYTSALASFEVGAEGLDSARAAQEASTNAAAAWRVHHETLVKQMAGREFYQSNPDAGNKAFLSGE